MSKLVSIIVPIYNVEKYLEKCLNSIINQSYSNIEIILINDGSTDRSLKICEKYLAMDKRIILASKENGGLSSARNLGIEKATGDYISFLDSDDFVDKKMYEILINNLESNNCDISIVGKCDIDENNQIISKQTKSDKKIIYSKSEAIEKCLDGEFISACGNVYRKDLFNEIKFPKGILNEDEAIMIKVFDSCNKNIIYQESELYFYLKRNGSITNNNNNAKNNIDWVYNSYQNLKYVENKYYNLQSKAEARYFISILALIEKLYYLNNIELVEVRKDNIKKLKNLKTKIFNNNIISRKLKIKFFICMANTSLYMKLLKNK